LDPPEGRHDFNKQFFGVNEQILGRDQSDQVVAVRQPTLSDRCYNADVAPQVT
jgi:hypothetical protein